MSLHKTTGQGSRLWKDAYTFASQGREGEKMEKGMEVWKFTRSSGEHQDVLDGWEFVKVEESRGRGKR